MIIESGTIVFLGLLLMFFKLSWETRLKLFGRPLALDVIVSIVTLIIHWGTFSGVMAATVAGLLTSSMTGLGKSMFGYIDKHGYHPGHVDISHKLKKKQEVRRA